MKNLKKTLALILATILVMSLFTGCGAGGKAKTGLAVITSLSAYTKGATAEGDGLIQPDSTAAAVLIDSKGVIKDVVIDVVQSPITFNANGEITSDLNTEFDSKHDLKDAYDMKKASPIGKEWFEQAEALENYIIGKTIDEVKGIKVEDGYPAETDLESSVTMAIGDMINAVIKAAEQAEELGASANDKIGLGLTSTIAKSKNAGEEDGLAQAYTTYSVITLDKDNKISSSIYDASQANVNFNAAGEITTPSPDFKTKVELGYDYNMKDTSPIGKEWFEQAKSFSDHVKGKTVSEVTGITLVDGAAPDLSSSVTITIGSFLSTTEKAGVSAAK